MENTTENTENSTETTVQEENLPITVELEALVASVRIEEQKLRHSSVKSSAARLRKSLLSIVNVAKEGRKTAIELRDAIEGSK
jgi:hypothetical protein